MPDAAETYWQTNKDQVHEDIEALLNVGIPLETAKRLTNWNLTYEFDNYSDLRVQYPPFPTPSNSFPRMPADRLWVARSENRWQPEVLHQNMLDATKLYSVFIEDAPDAGIIQIEFFLDAISHHTEFSNPWDFNGTAGGGEANRFMFSAGFHTIDAVITDAFGIWNVSADFEVE